MKIKNIEGLTVDEMNREVSNGAKFVIYRYAMSFLVITLKRPSDIYFVRSNEKAIVKGLPYTFLTLVLGWWGIPWGPIYSIQSLAKNLGGGTDVTKEVIASLVSKSPTDEVQVR
jgi:hypothetical protein